MAEFSWPDRKRCAVALTFDADGETIPMVRDPHRGHDRLGLISEAAYGPKVGVPRILRVLDSFGLKATFFIPAYTAEMHPEMVRQIQSAGHEVGHHGYLHERPAELSDEDEETVLQKGLETLERLTGRRPVGYRSPAWELKRSSPALLKRYRFEYDTSLMGNDIPYLVPTVNGDLLELPIQWILDDHPHFSMERGGISSPEKVFEVWSSEFEGFHRFGGCYILTMHPFVSGRPSRIMLLERIIKYINTFDGVWWATLGEIASYSLKSNQCERWEIPDLIRRQ